MAASRLSSMSLRLAAACAVLLLPLADAGCRVVSTGSDAASTDLLLKGTVLTSAGALPNGRVLVRSGRIEYVGGSRCGGATEPAGVAVVECGGASVISPGFINPHEHIEYSTVTPLDDLGERVGHRHDWRLGLRGHTRRPADINGTATDATAWGELRHLFSGTTSIVGGAMAPGLTRNLDFVGGLEDGLVSPVATWDVFPLDDAASGRQRNGDCDYGGANAVTREAAGKLYRYMAHIAEGVDAEAANEFRCLSSESFDVAPQRPGDGGGLSADIILPNLSLVHALGLTEADFDLVAARGASVVWSPRSNVFLYGRTFNVSYLLQAGINVALGTDWLPSGSATMGREAACGASVMRASFDVALPPKTLWEMMTINAARAAGFGDHLGSLEAGKLADIVVFGGGGGDGDGDDDDDATRPGGDAFARAVFAGAEKLDLVIRGGKVLLASAGLDALARRGGSPCEPASFGPGVSKTICVQEELGSSFAAFEAALGGVYPAILPGVPGKEPTCEPTR